MQVQKPDVVFFLDVDGVLGPAKFTLLHQYQFNQKVKELLNGDNFHTYHCKRCITCSTAQAHLFKKEVVEALEEVVKKVEAVANVHIVISSMWRRERSVEDLKQIFHMHNFSKYIIDKTVDEYLSLEECNENCEISHLNVSYDRYFEACGYSFNAMSEEGFEKFKKENRSCRASQINKWLKDHPGYAAFVVIDDRDEHLSLNFGEKFISTDHDGVQILTPDDAEKIYQVAIKQLGI